jgi:hypothetical protein
MKLTGFTVALLGVPRECTLAPRDNVGLAPGVPQAMMF